jgi:lysine 2,3-aminomutase
MEARWKSEFQQSITCPSDLPVNLTGCKGSLEEVTERYPMLISPFILSLMKDYGKPLIRQFIPDPQELVDKDGLIDPLAEEVNSPVSNITHRYPDRVLFLVSGTCPVYCRFCTRKRRIGRPELISSETIESGIQYIQRNRNIKDVLLSGGDPLMLDNERLNWVLSGVKRIPHVEVVRIGSRVPVALPCRIDSDLVRVLRSHAPLYINIHVNHPSEISRDFVTVCGSLIEAGIPLATQTVLLRGINDNSDILESLFRRLLKMRIRPYYLLQADMTKGTEHFRTSIRKGLSIMHDLRGNVSGMAIPQFVIDLPGGGGKVPLLPQYVEKWGKEVVFRNYQGKRFVYPQPGE